MIRKSSRFRAAGEDSTAACVAGIEAAGWGDSRYAGRKTWLRRPLTGWVHDVRGGLVAANHPNEDVGIEESHASPILFLRSLRMSSIHVRGSAISSRKCLLKTTGNSSEDRLHSGGTALAQSVEHRPFAA